VEAQVESKEGRARKRDKNDGLTRKLKNARIDRAADCVSMKSVAGVIDEGKGGTRDARDYRRRITIAYDR